MAIPSSWDAAAHADWEAGRAEQAVARLLAQLEIQPSSPPDLALQAAYYFFLKGAFGPGRAVLEAAAAHHPDHLELIVNLGVFCARTGDPAAARARYEHYLALGGAEMTAIDGLTAATHRLGDDEAAARWGRESLRRKTEEAERGPKLALGSPRPEGRSIIAFSLWGDKPRYLRGALHNALRAPLVYPGFTCRFMVDASVPQDVHDALAGLGAEVEIDTGEPTTRRRLTRRFLIADDPSVARYLVRDCDSLVNAREAGAVRAWIDSEAAFHVMRDWWTHTDPMLAGMWGGRGGVLPPLAPLLEGYATNKMETPNWDQWFLRDRLWASARPHALVHDRCFHDGTTSLPLPGTLPPGNLHVGQDEYAVRREAQAAELARFARSVPSLRL